MSSPFLLKPLFPGELYQKTIRGNMFVATSAGTTGNTILGAGGTTAGFMFYNPSGSGVNMEIEQILVQPLTATDVVGDIGLEHGVPPTSGGTAEAGVNLLVGNTTAAKGSGNIGGTIVAMTFLMWLPIFVQTTAGIIQGSTLWDARGRLVLPPNTGVNIISTTTQSTNIWMQQVVWSEWPA